MHKLHYQLRAQYFYIYYTQLLHVLGIYPGHCQRVTSLVDMYSLSANYIVRLVDGEVYVYYSSHSMQHPSNINSPEPMKHTMKAYAKSICDVIQPIQKSSFLCKALSQQ